MVIKPASRAECRCSDPRSMILEKKRVSHFTALLLMTVFTVFVGGYFFGKRVASQELFEQLQEETFADRIHHSLHTFYKPVQSEDEDIKVAHEPSTEIEQATVPAQVPDAGDIDQVQVVAGSAPGLSDVMEKVTTTAAIAGPSYVAQLFGGNEHDTQKLASRLRARGIEARIIKRSSKSAAGKVVYWYQVVSERYTSKRELDALVANIKKIVKLHDIKIITV